MNSLVLGGDEGRGYRRYFSGSRKQALIRESPNEETPKTPHRQEEGGEPGEPKHPSSRRKRKQKRCGPRLSRAGSGEYRSITRGLLQRSLVPGRLYLPDVRVMP